jgi:hypothetical protein
MKESKDSEFSKTMNSIVINMRAIEKTKRVINLKNSIVRLTEKLFDENEVIGNINMIDKKQHMELLQKSIRLLSEEYEDLSKVEIEKALMLKDYK